MAALKGEGDRGNWARESAKGARGGGKREKWGKGSRFQHPRHPRAPEFSLSLPLLTPATQATPLSEILHFNFRKSMNKLHAVKL